MWCVRLVEHSKAGSKEDRIAQRTGYQPYATNASSPFSHGFIQVSSLVNEELESIHNNIYGRMRAKDDDAPQKYGATTYSRSFTGWGNLNEYLHMSDFPRVDLSDIMTQLGLKKSYENSKFLGEEGHENIANMYDSL
mmetsp:Transcript_3618/g.7318  ORF Transcript_3618/g.7318 Transcript_3618/m.7318 type:complete len:137 (-) Transcript_3618:191-601(-)